MPRTSRTRAFRHALVYYALAAATGAARHLSLRRARGVGRRLGRIAHALLRRERNKSLRHIAIAFPEKSDAERATLARAAFEHLGVSLLEICWMPSLNREVIMQTTRFEGLEHWDTARDSGAGAVIFTAHCGNWEWLAAAMGLRGYDISVVARDLGNERINDFVVEHRARHGVKSIGRGSATAAKELLRVLKSGKFLGVLIDQSIRAENVDVPFFGKAAPTPVGAAKMAIRAGAMAIVGFIERAPDGMQIIRFQPPVVTNRDDDPAELTRIMTAAIEAQIRRVPEQWVWMHDRWRRREKGPE